MRKYVVTCFALAVVSLCGFISISPARALTFAPVGLAAVIDEANPVQQAAYVCRNVRRCGPYGCGWHRACYWTGPRYRTFNGCPYGYTVQDGVCKPYRGY